MPEALRLRGLPDLPLQERLFLEAAGVETAEQRDESEEESSGGEAATVDHCWSDYPRGIWPGCPGSGMTEEAVWPPLIGHRGHIMASDSRMPTPGILRALPRSGNNIDEG